MISGRDNPLKLFRFFIPKNYNDGHKIPALKIKYVTDQIIDKFKGYTMNPNAVLPILEGVWIKKGNPYRDKVICIELFCQDTYENCDWVRDFCKMTRTALKQEALFVLYHDAELVPDLK